MTFSEQVNKYRRDTKMTQKELAEKCVVTSQTVVNGGEVFLMSIKYPQ